MRLARRRAYLLGALTAVFVALAGVSDGSPAERNPHAAQPATPAEPGESEAIPAVPAHKSGPPPPAPAPEPEPTPGPEPAPDPAPVPAPEPEPAPAPDPAAPPAPEPQPAPAPEDEPAPILPPETEPEPPAPAPAPEPGRVLEASSVDPVPLVVAAAPGSASVVVKRGAIPVSTAEGEVAVEANGVEGEDVRLVIVAPDGTESTLADGTARATWDTTGSENGPYVVEARAANANGDERVVASTRVFVENPRSTVPVALAGVAASAALSAGWGALSARVFDAFGLARQAAGDLATEVAEEKARTRTASASFATLGARVRRVRAAAWWLATGGTRFGLAMRLSLAVALLVAFKTWAGAPSAAEFLAALPIAGAAILLFTVADYGAEFALARASGATAKFRLWAPGALSLALSALVLRSPFGYPGYVDEDEAGDDDAPPQRRLAGIRAVAFLGAGVALAAPFALLGLAWRWEFAEAGIGVALMMTAAASMPFAPMPGRDVWAWSRRAWLATFAVAVGLYLLWQLAALPAWALGGAAVLGAAGFLSALLGLRKA